MRPRSSGSLAVEPLIGMPLLLEPLLVTGITVVPLVIWRIGDEAAGFSLIDLMLQLVVSTFVVPSSRSLKSFFLIKSIDKPFLIVSHHTVSPQITLTNGGRPSSALLLRIAAGSSLWPQHLARSRTAFRSGPPPGDRR
jgi:hypothetical protein